VGGLVLFALAALGLAAMQLVPSWEFMRLSSRAALGYQELSAGFAVLDFVQILLPHATGFWSPLYVGILPLLFALFALLSAPTVGDGVVVQDTGAGRRWRLEIGFWTVLAVLALLLSLGDETFLYGLFYLYVPGFGLFRGQERAALVFSFSLSLMAGYGFAALLRWGQNVETRQKGYRLFLRLILTVGLAILALLGLLFYGRTAAPSDGVMDAILAVAAFVGLLLAGSLTWLGVWRWRRGAPLATTALALVLIFVDLFTVNARPNIQSRKIENQFPVTGVIEALMDQPGIYRVHNEFRLPGNYGVAFGVEDTWGASPLRLASYERLFEQVPLERVWELLNVGYVVTWLEDLDVPAQPVYQEQARRGEVDYVQKLQREHPRAWIVYQIEELADEDAVLNRLAQPDFDPYGVALLSGPEAESMAATLGAQPGGESGPSSAGSEEGSRVQQADFVELSPTRLSIKVDQPAVGLLVLSEVYYPGWQARVDGERVPLLLADAVLRAVQVPPGQHVVEMIFEPGSVQLGLAISAATLLASAGYAIWYWVHRVKRSSDLQPASE
jgi:hypothetical protein